MIDPSRKPETQTLGKASRTESGDFSFSSLIGGFSRPVVVGFLLVLVASISFGLGYFQTAHAIRTAPKIITVEAQSPAASEPASGVQPPTEMTQSSGQPFALQWPLWEYRLQEPLIARDPPLTPVNWRLLGAAYQQGQWRIIVLRQGKGEPEYFKVADKLPGGYVVREINQENVTFVSGRREIVLAYIGSR